MIISYRNDVGNIFCRCLMTEKYFACLHVVFLPIIVSKRNPIIANGLRWLQTSVKEHHCY